MSDTRLLILRGLTPDPATAAKLEAKLRNFHPPRGVKLIRSTRVAPAELDQQPVPFGTRNHADYAIKQLREQQRPSNVVRLRR